MGAHRFGGEAGNGRRRFFLRCLAVVALLAPAGSVAFPAAASADDVICAPGTFSATGFAPCTPAPPGSYVSVGGATSATPCDPGFYSGEGGGATSCAISPPGYHVAVAGSVLPVPCPAGTFSAGAGAIECTLAPIDHFVPVEAATLPTPCPPGTHSPILGATVCVPVGSTVPGPITDVSTFVTPTLAVFSFRPPAEDGGAPIDHYEIDSGESSFGAAHLRGDRTSIPDPATLRESFSISPGLAGDCFPQVEIRVVNQLGEAGLPAQLGTVCFDGGNGHAMAAQNVVATSASEGVVELRWSVPAGAVILGSPVVTSTPPLPAGATSTIAVGGRDFSGLDPGTTYVFTVRYNAEVEPGVSTLAVSAPSNPVTPNGVAAPPTAPSNVVATSSGTGLTRDGSVSFDPSLPNGAAVTGYTVTAVDFATSEIISVETPGSPATLTGLVPGHTYQISVVAHSTAGDSAPGVAELAVPGISFATPAVTGRVTAGDGSVEVCVSIASSLDVGTVLQQTCSTEGTFTFSNLSLDTQYHVTGTAVGFAPETRIVPAALEATPTVFSLQPAARITGRITHTDGTPVADARAVATDSFGRNYTSRAATSADFGGSAVPPGAYVLDGLPALEYRVQLLGGPFDAPEYWENSATLAGATLIPTTGGGTVSGIDGELGQGGSISGRVRDAAGGVVPSIVVATVGDTAHQTTVLPDGTFRIDGVPAGAAEVVAASDPSFGSFWAPSDPVAVTVADGADSDVGEIVLTPISSGMEISGTVTRSNGQPVSRVTIVLTSTTTPPVVYRTATAPDGTYAISPLPPIVFRLTATPLSASGLLGFDDGADHYPGTGVIVDVTLQSATGVTVPAAPTDPTASAASGTVTVRWTDASSDEDGFTIQRGRWNGAEWTGWASFQAPADATTFSETVPDGRYAYVVASFNTAGSSDAVIATVDSSTATAPPTAPTGPAAVRTSTGVRVSWVDGSSDEQGFEILRAHWLGGAWTEWTTFVADRDATFLHVPDVVDGGYAYLVRSFNAVGSSEWAITITTHSAATAPPAAPPGAAASANVADVTVSWTDASSDETGFGLARARYNPTTGGWGEWAYFSADRDATSFTDIGVPDGQYVYAVRSVNPLGVSEWVFTGLVLVSDPFSLPAAPANVRLTDQGGSVLVEWDDMADNEVTFEVMRAEFDGSSWTGWTSWPLDKNTTAYSDTTAPTGDLAYLVRASNAVGASDWVTVVRSN